MIPDDVKVYVLTVEVPDHGNYEDAWWDEASQQMVTSWPVGVFDSEEHARQAVASELGDVEIVRTYITALPWNKVGKGKYIGEI